MEKIERKLEQARLAEPVYVSIPAKVAYDFDKFVEVQRSIFDRLGHLNCTSGFDIRWDITTRFMVDEKLNIRDLPELDVLEGGQLQVG